jgi:formylglycine-generating enzyme required for sulfatase activity
MKRKLFYPIIALLFIVAASSCKKEPGQGVILDSEQLFIAVGKTATLTPAFVPPNAYNKEVSWESADPNVATVDNGIVTGIAAGKTTIKVVTQDGGKTARCTVFVIFPIEPEMVWVEGGTFIMGCTDDECMDHELPTHEVTLSGFYIGKYEVTQKEWVAIMGINPSDPRFPESIGDNIPVHCISWNEVQRYISRLNEMTDKNYRLPTEAEWEYAARGGKQSKGYKYSGSNNVNTVAWYSGNTDPRPRHVGTKAPNELGIYDMSGNVFEFCSDLYGSYTDEAQINPTGYGTGGNRVMRGGGWTAFSRQVRIPSRSYSWNGDSQIICITGLRLVHPKITE